MRRGVLISGVLLGVLLVIWFGVIPYPWTLDRRNPQRTALMEQRIEEAREAGVPFEIRREWVSLDQVSPELIRAVLVAEDHRFRQHDGIDWEALAEEVEWTGDDAFSWWSPSDLGALARAVAHVWRNRNEVRGRSSITQQLAKNLYFGTERSFFRKAMEFVVARRLERRLGKDRILELYLNVAEWGDGIFGAQAAAREYFGRSASSLTLDQGAALAATLPHPLTSNPARSPRRMLWRKELVLGRLLAPPDAPPEPLPPPDLVMEPPPDLPVAPPPGLAEDPMASDSAPLEATPTEPTDSASPREPGPPPPPGDSTAVDTLPRTSDDPGLLDDAGARRLPVGSPSGGTGRRAGVESVAELAEGIASCREGCAGVVYVWSDRMPLSRAGMDLIARAAREVGVEHTFVKTELLASYARPPAPTAHASTPGIGREILASGALAHAPAVVAHADGRVLGPAIFGYKTAAAYASAIRRRLKRARADTGATMEGGGRAVVDDAGVPSAAPGAVPRATRLEGRFQTVAELEAVGRPGAYFRWVPGREVIAYESGGRIYLLDLSEGQSREAPGYVDFVPTPDGRFFVTPAPRRSGMAFYDADEVFRAADAGEPGRVAPFFTDPAMRDQYPSVGILRQEDDPPRPESGTVFRVLTSWFEGISYRDYRVTGGSGVRQRAADIRPLAEPVEPCRDRRISIPIMSQSGREVAARDESTGTTKIFRIREGGGCEEILDLGVQTGKVAWHWSGRLLAFVRPPEDRRIGPGGRFRGAPVGPGDRGAEQDGNAEAADGIFLFDREEDRLWRVPDSEDASALAFPEFIGGDRLVYLVPGGSGEPSVFRVVEGSW